MQELPTISVTGSGFYRSALVRHLTDRTDHAIVNVDEQTYAGNLESLSEGVVRFVNWYAAYNTLREADTSKTIDEHTTATS